MDTYADEDDEEEEWSSDDTACEEGCYLDGVYYVYPKAV